MAGWQVQGFSEVRELGTGAQGRVVLARHDRSATPVAIKYLTGDDRRAIERLHGEAQLLARVTDAHVARLYQFVTGAQGAAIVMEAVDGVSLKEILTRHGALGPEASLLVLKGSLLGLAAAHAVGVVHRDYKPANVVVQPDGLSKLIDFGIAALAGEGARSGTPVYMAPEQWRGDPASPATDVYAATCVFFECVTGNRPFRADDQVALMGRHMTAPIPVEELPEALHGLVQRGMAKDASHRPPGATAFVAELEQAAVAAYGPEWEQRGIRALAAAAVALASLFPLAALGMAPAVPGAGGAGIGTAGAGQAAMQSTAGSAAQSAAPTAAQTTAAHSTATAAKAGGKGLLAKAGGAKATLLVVGSAVAVATAGGGGTILYNQTKSDDGSSGGGSGGSSRPVSLRVASLNQSSSNPPVRVPNAQYVQVSGGDPALVNRINQELRRPLDWLIGNVRQGATNPGFPCTKSAVAQTKVRAGLLGPNVASAVYDLHQETCFPSDGDYPAVAVTVDLKTGRALTAQDIFQPAALSGSALRGRLTLKKTRATQFCESQIKLPGSSFTASNRGSGTPWPIATVLFTQRGLEVIWGANGSGSCIYGEFTAPYAKVRDLLKPEMAARLPAS